MSIVSGKNWNARWHLDEFYGTCDSFSLKNTGGHQYQKVRIY